MPGVRRLALPFLESSARGAPAPGAPPLRLVIFVKGEGDLPKLWLPPDWPTMRFELSEMLQPLSGTQRS